MCENADIESISSSDDEIYNVCGLDLSNIENYEITINRINYNLIRINDNMEKIDDIIDDMYDDIIKKYIDSEHIEILQLFHIKDGKNEFRKFIYDNNDEYIKLKNEKMYHINILNNIKNLC
jgi:hypothetical protein